ncbi:MAG TPA: hypothetical protein VIJ73_01360 [Methylomirabilota bacterium]
MPYATLNGIRIPYDLHGEGDPVLLINGLSAAEAPSYPTSQMADDAAAMLGHGFTIERWEDFNRAVQGFLPGVKQ